MLIRQNITEAVHSLASAKQRTLLALIGIVIGIGSVIGMLSIGTIVKNEALLQFKDMGIDIIKIAIDYNKINLEEHFSLSDIVQSPEYIDSIVEVAPFTTTASNLVKGHSKMDINLFGTVYSFFSLNSLKLEQGRFISDFDTNMFFCTIGSNVAAFLKKAGVTEPLGKKIHIKNRFYKIVGVMADVPNGGGLRPYGLNDSVILPITTSLRVDKVNKIRSFFSRIKEEGDPETNKRLIQKYFNARNKKLYTQVRSAEELIARMEKQMQMFTLLLGSIGSISLIVGGVGVMNVMLVSVTERRKEIGIRRALGATAMDVQSQFLIESIALTFIGGLIGVLLGVGVSWLVCLFSNWSFMLSYSAIILGVTVSSVIGIFFGFYPARQAARLDPIAALRS